MSRDPDTPRRRASRIARAALRTAVTSVVLLAALGTLVHLPPVRHAVRRLAEREASRALGARVEVASLDYRLLAGTVDAGGIVAAGEGERTGTSIRADGVHLDLSMRSLLRGHLVVEEARIDGLAARLALDGSGRLLLPFEPPAEEPPKPAGRPDVVVERLAVTGGLLELDDRGPSRRRVEIPGFHLAGSLRLRELQGEGSLALGPVTVAGDGKPPLGRTTLSLDWSFRGASGSAKGRLDAPEAGFSADLAGELRDVDSAPRYSAVVTASGTLGPLAERLFPGLGLAGRLTASLRAEGPLDGPPTGSGKATVEELLVSGRRLDRVELAGSLTGERVASLTADVLAGGGRLRAEARTSFGRKPERTTWRVRLDGFPAERLLPERSGGPHLASDLSGTVEGRHSGLTLPEVSASADLTLVPSPRRRPRSVAPEGRARLRLENGVLAVDELRVVDGETHAEVGGTWDFRQGAFMGTADFEAPRIAPYLALADLEGRGEVGGHLEGRGTVERPELSGTLRGRSLAIGGATIDRVDLKARLDGPRLSATDGSVSAHGASASFDADADLARDGRPSRVDVRVCGIRYGKTALPDLHAEATISRTVSATLTSSDGRVALTAEIPPRGAARAEARFDRVDLAFLAPFLPGTVSGFGGELTGDATAVFGAGEAPLVEARIGRLSVSASGRSVVASGASGTLRDGRLEVQGLELAGDDGSGLSLSGSAAVDGSDLDVQLRAEVPDLSAWASLAPEGAGLAGSVSADLTIGGSLSRPRPSGSVKAASLAAGGLRAGRVEAALEPRGEEAAARLSLADFRFGDLTLKEAKLSATLHGDTITAVGSTWEERLRLEAEVALASPWPFRATVDLASLDLGPVALALGAPRGLAVTASGRAVARGEGGNASALAVDVDLTALEASHGENRMAAAGPVGASYRAGRLEIRSLTLEGTGLTLSASGSLRRDGSSSEKLTIAARGDLASLLPFVPQLDRAEGTLQGSLDVTGSLARPSLSGTLTLAGGLLDGPAFPVPLERLDGSLSLTPGAVAVDSLTARVGDGPVSVGGSVTLDGFSPRRVEATLRARDVDVPIGKDLQVRGGADLEASGTWPRLAVTGEVRIEDATYAPKVELMSLLPKLTEKPRRPKADGKRRPGEGLEVSLDVAVVAIDAIHVEGNLGEVDLGGSLRVTGTAAEPVAVGHVASSRGTVNILGSRFDLTRARLEFQDPRALDPDVDVVGVTTKSDDEITARISGKASKAQLLLSSSKGKSQAETLALLLGGSSGSSSTALADAAARTAARGAAAPILGAVGMQTDLEIVPLPTTPEGEEFLFSIGKDLGGGLSATYLKGSGGANPDAFELKWRISSKTRGRLRQNQDGSLSGGFRVRRDFN